MYILSMAVVEICALVLMLVFIDQNSTVLVLVLQDGYCLFDIRTMGNVILVLSLFKIVSGYDLITQFFLYSVLVLS